VRDVLFLHHHLGLLIEANVRRGKSEFLAAFSNDFDLICFFELNCKSFLLVVIEVIDVFADESLILLELLA